MATQVAETEIVRPLRVLVPLIRQELEAAEQAAAPHYQHIGEMLLEAKAQLGHGEWLPWLAQNFQQLGRAQAQRYMSLASSLAKSKKSLEELFGTRRDGKARSPLSNRNSASWYKPVQATVSTVDVERLTRDQQSRAREAQMTRELGLKLIEIGYKVLATKLHPDKGGSADAMARLNNVRKVLRDAL